MHIAESEGLSVRDKNSRIWSSKAKNDEEIKCYPEVKVSSKEKEASLIRRLWRNIRNSCKKGRRSIKRWRSYQIDVKNETYRKHHIWTLWGGVVCFL